MAGVDLERCFAIVRYYLGFKEMSGKTSVVATSERNAVKFPCWKQVNKTSRALQSGKKCFEMI